MPLYRERRMAASAQISTVEFTGLSLQHAGGGKSNQLFLRGFNHLLIFKRE